MSGYSISAYEVAARLATVCPKAPPGAQKHLDDITGYVEWGVLALFFIGIVVAIGAAATSSRYACPRTPTALVGKVRTSASEVIGRTEVVV